MQSFEIKRGHGKTLEDGGLKMLMEEEFGDITEIEHELQGSFKALKTIKANISLLCPNCKTNEHALKEQYENWDSSNPYCPSDCVSNYQIAQIDKKLGINDMNSMEDEYIARAKKEEKKLRKLNSFLFVETETDIDATPEDSLAAHQAYNRFMEGVTGFTAKQRVDRAKAQAKKDAKIAAEREMPS
jgi:hypothetical protein